MLVVIKYTTTNPPQAPNAPQPKQVVLQQPFSNQEVVTQQQYPHPLGDRTFQNIYMNIEFNLQIQAKFMACLTPRKGNIFLLRLVGICIYLVQIVIISLKTQRHRLDEAPIIPT